MANVRRADTSPELRLRKILHARGYRYQLHRKDLPGSPDLVFPSRKKVVFVHGCYWHHHTGCQKATIPKTRTSFWLKKFADNRERDRRKCHELSTQGWDVFIVWECELKDETNLIRRLTKFLDGD